MQIGRDHELCTEPETSQLRKLLQLGASWEQKSSTWKTQMYPLGVRFCAGCFTYIDHIAPFHPPDNHGGVEYY